MGAAIGRAGVRGAPGAVLESVLMATRWTSLICVLSRFQGESGPQGHQAASRPWLVYAPSLESELFWLVERTAEGPGRRGQVPTSFASGHTTECWM